MTTGTGLARFRSAVEAVISHNRGERILSEAAVQFAPSDADAAAVLRRACSFGYCELREVREVREAAAAAPDAEKEEAEDAVPLPSPRDLHRPSFHLGPRTGWLNDPNGLVFVGGRYHACFQHQPDRGACPSQAL